MAPGAVAAAGLGFILAAGVAADDGGIFSDTWAWVALLTMAMATVLLVVRPRVELRTLDWLYVGALLLLTGWAALSAIWSPTTTGALNDVARLLAYVGAVGLCLLVVGRRTVPHLLGGVLTGVVAVCVYALLTRLQPNRLGEFQGSSTYRLSVPIDYWNGLGAYAAMGALLAFGLAARAEGRLARALAAAAPVALVPTLYFTFSRGAWIALAAGLLVAVALGPRRLQLLWTLVVLAPWPALALLLSSRSDALTIRGSTLEAATHDGGRLLVWLSVLAVGAGLMGAALAEAERQFDLERGVRIAFAVLLAACALGGLAMAWQRYDSPWRAAERGWEQFWSQPPESSGRGDTTDLGASVFSLAPNGRAELWRVAWDGFESTPLAGLGAGSFAHTWYARRPVGLTTANDAHGLYVETLSELGVVGFALLLLLLAAPAVAAIRARCFGLLPAATGAYGVFLVHAGVDWDWELAGVTLVALLSGCALVAAARSDRRPRRLSGLLRIALPLAGGALALVAAATLLASLPLGKARDAAERRNWSTVAAEARRASAWAPWSSEPWLLLGESQRARGQIGAARVSFRTAVAKDPRNWLLWFRLAGVSTGETRRAALQTALRLNPQERQIQLAIHP
jgi:hypothetical protein